MQDQFEAVLIVEWCCSCESHSVRGTKLDLHHVVVECFEDWHDCSTAVPAIQ
jgi:hypothetical protein